MTRSPNGSDGPIGPAVCGERGPRPGPFPPVASLVPHEPPMLLVDEIVAWDGVEAVVRARVRAGQPFAVDGSIPATVCLEYMAQGIACAAGMHEREGGRKVTVGLLLGTRDLRLEIDALAVGDDLRIWAAMDFFDDTIARYDCRIERAEGAVELARGALTVIVAEREQGERS